ncbi:unnamed protein product, partial [Fusarium equiseti]
RGHFGDLPTVVVEVQRNLDTAAVQLGGGTVSAGGRLVDEHQHGGGIGVGRDYRRFHDSGRGDYLSLLRGRDDDVFAYALELSAEVAPEMRECAGEVVVDGVEVVGQ